jgi:7-keto-8-aminopelargonate synthetase-like enzyme
MVSEKASFICILTETKIDSNQIVLKGKKVVNFGSCSYLGLEFDPRLKEAAKSAIDHYGTQFSGIQGLRVNKFHIRN